MSEFEPRAVVESALSVLVDGLEPVVHARFAEVAPQVPEWTEIIAQKDRQSGRHIDRYNARDLSILLRAMTENFGTLGYPFSGILNRQSSNCASELRDVRNRWAHNEEFSVAEVYRALDSAGILLRAVGADEAAARLAPLAAITLLALTPEPAVTSSSGTDTTHPDPEPIDATDRPSTDGPRGQATIDVSTVPVVSYVHARNGVPLVDEITITYAGPDIDAASVEVEVVGELGPLSDPHVVIVRLTNAAATIIRGPELRLDTVRMADLQHPTSGSICVTVRDEDGRLLASRDSDIKILAASQWLAEPLQLSLELLPGFVQPQAAAIAPLLVEASDRLRTSTGRPDLDGYQSASKERVDKTAEAIYDAMRARDIRYSEPPASWGLVGQKVRTPADVLNGRLGTCLDTTVTLAAALEEAGINSTLWLFEGHIFLGYWRVDGSLSAPADVDASEAISHVGEGLELIETTKLTGGDASLAFADARRAAHALLSHETPIGVIDIRAARSARVFPLPSRTVNEDGTVEVREYAVPSMVDGLEYVPNASAIAGGTARTLPPRISQWKNALLDLSLRNRLINYTGSSGFPIAVADQSLPVFEDMVNAGTSITLIPGDRIPQVDRARGLQSAAQLPAATLSAQLTERKSAFIGITDATYTSRLRALAYKAKTIVEETGANNLYLAFGMLRWTFNDRELRSPLVLVPVTLEAAGRGQSFRISLDDAGESTPNYCLLEKLRQTFGLQIPGLANPAKDDSGIDLPAAFGATRQALAKERLPFQVEDTVDLAIFQFAKYRLWKDLDEHWESLAGNPLVTHLIHTPTSAFSDPVAAVESIDLDALGNAVPVPADSSQLEAVADAAAGRTFVLEGPPGTGKSQTITNIVANTLAQGKRVLFVAEKRAALDVVKQRLDAVGLSPFALDLHDKGARPTAIRAQIREAIDAVAHPDGSSLKTNTETAASSRGALRRYAERLHDANSAGLSLYGARSQFLASTEDVDALEVPASLVSGQAAEKIDEIRGILRTLPETADLAHPAPLHPWGFIDPRQRDQSAAVGIHPAAQEFDAALTDLNALPGVAELLRDARSPKDLEEWASLARAPRHPLDAVDAVHQRVLSGEIPALQQQLAAAAPARDWFAQVGPEVLTTDISPIQTAAAAADASGFFGRKKRQRAVLTQFGAALKVDPKTIRPRSVTPLIAEIAAASGALGGLRQALSTLPITVVTHGWNPYLADDAKTATTTLEWAVWTGRALAPSTTDTSWRHGLRSYYAQSAADQALSAQITRVANAWRALAVAIGATEEAGIELLDRWGTERGVIETWEATRAARHLETSTPVTLERWYAFVSALEPLRAAAMTDARESLMTGRVPADLAVLAFDKGIAATSVIERSESQALMEFDVAAHSRTIQRFTDSAAAIRDELPRWVPAEIIAKRRINPAYDGGAMGELKRQLSRQRGGMSVRALFENYGDIITQVAPCALMSPESVSRFLPANERLFEVVVFDEASQIRVADAVGAMGRASSVVVVGDSKQMPPTTFAETAVDDEDTAPGAVADEESILTECVQSRVPQKWLSWHYRSQDETLISFSNHAYYDSRLSSFPAPWPAAGAAANDGHGVSLVRVNGHFNRSGKGRDLRTNIVEAEAIVRDVSQRFAESPGRTPSLGIITFNSQQRTLIESLLREAPDERIAQALDERDGLFVKNLENVQGDERDLILFSVAFSANDRGVVPLNFGPLTRAGGERRLNVAITRARREVVLYASFDPSELRAEQTTSVGIKHLKGYLELAVSGVEAASDSPNRLRIVDRHRDEIAAELRMRGFAVSTDVGLSDFRIDLSIAAADEPDQPLLAVLLDGDLWRARRTVADRDGLPIEVLGKLMKWPGVERIWMPEWLQQREQTLERLATAVEVARDRLVEMQQAPDVPITITSESERISAPSRFLPDGAPPIRSSASPGAVTSPEEIELSHPNLRDFTPWRPNGHGTTQTLDELPGPAAVARVRRAIQDAVTAEGPIDKMRLAKLVAESFGLSKVSAKRAESILRCVPAELLRSSDPSCVWPEGADPESWLVARRSGPGEGRPLDQTPIDEIANAMAVVTELAGGMSEEEIKRESLALFGGKRLTEGISARLSEALARALVTGRVDLDDRGRYLAAIR